MRKVWAIAWKDLQVAFADRRRWLRMFLLPALAIYLIGLGTQELARGFTPAIVVGVWDRDNSPTSRAFLAKVVRGHPALTLEDLTPALGQRGEEGSEGKGSAATLIIPADFAAALAEGRPTALEFTPGAGLVAPEVAFAAVRNAALRTAGPIIAADRSTALAASLGLATDPPFRAARLAEAEASWKLPPIRVITEMSGATERAALGAQLMENGFRLSTPSIAAMFVMISLLSMAQSLTEERTFGILRRVGMMPVRKGHLLAGRLLAGTVLGWSQFAVMLGFGLLLGIRFGPQPWLALTVAAAYALAIAALSLALAAVARSPNQAVTLATLTWLVLVPLGGGWWPLLLVPAWMRDLGHLSPVAWCLDALNALIFGGGGWAAIVRPVGVLLLFAAAFFIFGATRLDYTRAGNNDTGFSSSDKVAFKH